MDGVKETHSQAGHRWLKTHLAAKGKTEEELATTLWEKNWTAIAEVCSNEDYLGLRANINPCNRS
jgi:tRNA ligase